MPSLLFLLFDTLLPSLAVSFKRQGDAGLVFRTANGVKRRRKRGPEWYTVIGLSILNVMLGAGLQGGFEFVLTEVLNLRSALQVTTTLPMPWTIAKGVAINFLLREVGLSVITAPGAKLTSSQALQYYIQRFLLHPASPNPISNLHNTYAHSVCAPYAFTSHYDHPIPWIFSRFLPTYFPSIVFRTHLLTHFIFLSLVTLEETITFSGYTSIPGILLGGIARRQDLHMESGGKGNFGAWGLLDWVHGTSLGNDVMDDMKDEVEKHQVKERGGRALSNAKSAGSEGLRAWNGRRKSSRKA